VVTGVPASLPPVPVARVTFGRSVQGRRLSFMRVGDRRARVRVLVVGSIHGNEDAGRRTIRRLSRARPPAGTALWLVPTLNPDGEHAGIRFNARGVDLNRNCPWRWAPTGPPGFVYYAGPRASSEPETRALERLVRRIRPRASIWYHQHLRLVYRQGGARPGLIRAYGRRRGSTAWVVELPPGRQTLAAAHRHARAVLAVARTLRGRG
jgi:protein MpaA